eukprot:1210072-Heterocapsa_arctica.AAC.1
MCTDSGGPADSNSTSSGQEGWVCQHDISSAGSTLYHASGRRRVEISPPCCRQLRDHVQLPQELVEVRAD